VLDTDLDGEPLHLHICEVGPGERSHPPHRHGGIEGFSMVDGEGTLEIDDDGYSLRANEGSCSTPRSCTAW
jgi:uncharacterized cupin superfamily protein